MNTKSIIEIFRGDDSDALGYQTIVGTIHTDLDLAGCKAVFRYLGFFQEFDPIPEDGKLTIVIPAASSIQFPPGLGYASLKIYDIDRKVRTFTNRIPVFVSTKTPCRCGGEFGVEFSPFPELEPLKIFIGPNADDYDLYTGFVMKIIDRASAEKYGLSMIYDDMDSDMDANSGVAASPVAVKAAYDAILGMLADNYYNKKQTDEQIDKLAAYYITADAQGHPFATHAALVNATTYYSGGSVRTPTRNDYAIVMVDETHNNEEWRYIYTKNDQGVGRWEPQYAVEGVIAYDNTVTPNSSNGVKSSGIWSAIWGALSALPTGFSSLYDWCVSQLADKLNRTEAIDGFTEWEASSIPSGYVLYSCTYNGNRFWDVKLRNIDPSMPGVALLVHGGPNATTLSGTGFQLTRTKIRPTKTSELTNDGNGNSPFALAASPATAGNLAALDASGNPTDSGKKPSDFQSALSAQQLANIAAVSDALAFDTTRSYAAGDPVVYNGTLYTFTSAHTGPWTGSDVSAVDIIARLAGKLDKSGGTMTGSLEMGEQQLLFGNGRYCIVQFGNSLAILDVYNAINTKVPFSPTGEGTLALTANIPYDLVTKTIDSGAVSLDDRAINAVAVSSSLASLTVNFPTATSGKARDFGLRLTVASGITTAPELALPQGVVCENADGEAPEIGADGAATILYFTETASGVFLVKGEVVQTITQA